MNNFQYDFSDEDITGEDEEALADYLAGRQEFLDTHYEGGAYLYDLHMKLTTQYIVRSRNAKITTRHREAM